VKIKFLNYIKSIVKLQGFWRFYCRNYGRFWWFGEINI